MQQDQSSPQTYNPRVIFPVQHIFLQKVINIEGGVDALTIKYDEEGNYLTAGCKDGSVRVISTSEKNNTLFILNPQEQSPVTCIALNPKNKKLKNSLIATYVEGRLGYWHMTSNQLLAMKQTEKMLYCCGFSQNGVTYSYGGLQAGRLGKHSNRVYCTKWHPTDPNLLFTGGWDQTVYFWDVRCKQAVNKVYKAAIGGESIDIKGDLVLMGNLQQQYQLKLYDIKASKLIQVEWNDYTKNKSMVIGANFIGEDKFLAASIMTNEIRMYQSNTCIDIFQLAQKPIYAMTVSPIKNQFAVSSGNGKIHVFNY